MATLAERFVEDLGRASDFPSKPQVLLGLISALARPDVALRDVAEIIRHDPFLSAQMLRVANSAIYAPQVRIFSITDALMRIGLIQTRRLAFALSLYNVARRPEFFRHQQAFWLHSLGTAHAAAAVTRRMSVATGEFDAEQMFLLGLFHDVGLVALASHYPTEYAKVKEFAAKSQLPLDAAEVVVLGTDHGELGGLLAAYWKLPPAAVEVIRTHHSLDRVPEELSRVQMVLQVAEWLCGETGIADLGEGSPAPVDALLLDELGLPADGIQDVVWEVRGETERTNSVLAAAR